MATGSGTYGPGKLVQRLPVTEGAVVGIVTHLAGLVATFLLLVVDPEFEFGASRTVQVGTVDEVGWLFFGAHFARVERTQPFFGEGGTEKFRILAETAVGLPAAAFYAVPVVLLIAGGFLHVASRELWDTSARVHAMAGGTVVAGYFPLAALGVFLFETQVGVEESAFTLSPELSSTIILVGLVYPLLFGAVGGLLAWLVRS